jgi:hypothetical protein
VRCERLIKSTKWNVDSESCLRTHDNASIISTTSLILTTKRLILINRFESNQVSLSNISSRMINTSDSLSQIISMTCIQRFRISLLMSISLFILSSNTCTHLSLNSYHCWQTLLRVFIVQFNQSVNQLARKPCESIQCYLLIINHQSLCMLINLHESHLQKISLRHQQSVLSS